MVCWGCGRNRADWHANFGLEATIDGWWDVVLPMEAIYRHIPARRRIPDYGLHRVLRVTICGISGMRDAVSAATGKSAAVDVRNFFQPMLDVARMATKTVTKGRMAKGNDSANAKGNVRLECAYTPREPAVGMGDSRYREFHKFLLCFARNLVPLCAFLVLSSAKVRSNKCVRIRGFK